jgi:hypothetical protein
MRRRASKLQIIDEPRAAEFGRRECDQWLPRRGFAQIAAPPDGDVVRLPTSCAQGVQRVALNPRGERYSPDTIRGILAMRDFMDTMRSSGNIGGGPPPLTQANRNAFAGHLDTWLARRSSAAEPV